MYRLRPPEKPKRRSSCCCMWLFHFFLRSLVMFSYTFKSANLLSMVERQMAKACRGLNGCYERHRREFRSAQSVGQSSARTRTSMLKVFLWHLHCTRGFVSWHVTRPNCSVGSSTCVYKALSQQPWSRHSDLSCTCVTLELEILHRRHRHAALEIQHVATALFVVLRPFVSQHDGFSADRLLPG